MSKKPNRAKLWHPTEEQFLAVKEIATLGWSSAKIACAFGGLASA
jgi:hypothetical protein